MKFIKSILIIFLCFNYIFLLYGVIIRLYSRNSINLIDFYLIAGILIILFMSIFLIIKEYKKAFIVLVSFSSIYLFLGIYSIFIYHELALSFQEEGMRSFSNAFYPKFYATSLPLIISNTIVIIFLIIWRLQLSKI